MKADNKSHDPSGPPPELLENLFNSVSEGVFSIDLGYRITAINDSALKTIGMTRSQALGQPCHKVFRASICAGNCALRSTIESGDPIVDMPVKIKDNIGRLVPVTLSTGILRNKDGKVIGGVETFQDLTRVRQFLKDVGRKSPFQGIVTDDPQMKQLLEILPTIARSDSNILVLGETGTGKNLLVRAIHNMSPRWQDPLITVNCSALPETLLESELFGYKAGAFTGAIHDKPGRLAAAEGGTLFLDEVGDIPLSMQVKLLRVLQEKVYERLGDQTPIPCNIRFITATHNDLARMVKTGEFRRDLYYRINVLNVDIPPLRERKGDIPILAQRFLERHARTKRKSITGISSAALECLMHHDYPGNIRELENVIEHAWVMSRGSIIGVENLPDKLRGLLLSGEVDYKSGFAPVEAAFILRVLERNNWSRTAAADELGIHRTTLVRKIRKLGVKMPALDGRSRIGNEY